MNKSTYIFSFTAASLRLNELVKVAKYAHEHGIVDFNMVKDAGIVFSDVKSRTSDRQFREIRHRLEMLTNAQLEILINDDLIGQKHMALLAACKQYAFIKDFITDVLREKILVFNYQLYESDFNSFINNKLQEHPELEEFGTVTFKKAKQVMFLMFEQAGIIDNTATKRILPQLLSPAVTRAIADDDPNLLKIFMFSDRDINELKF